MGTSLRLRSESVSLSSGRSSGLESRGGAPPAYAGCPVQTRTHKLIQVTPVTAHLGTVRTRVGPMLAFEKWVAEQPMPNFFGARSFGISNLDGQ
jgi:hypothetical protein